LIVSFLNGLEKKNAVNHLLKKPGALQDVRESRPDKSIFLQNLVSNSLTTVERSDGQSIGEWI